MEIGLKVHTHKLA